MLLYAMFSICTNRCEEVVCYFAIKYDDDTKHQDSSINIFYSTCCNQFSSGTNSNMETLDTFLVLAEAGGGSC